MGGVAAGSLVPLSLNDVLQCVALREGARTGRLDALRIPRAPLDVLAQVLLGMAVEGLHRDPPGCDVEAAYELVRRAAPYQELARSDFDSILEYLSGGGKVLGGYDGVYGKIVFLDAGRRFVAASRRVAREFYLNAGVISDDVQIRVVSHGNRRRLGDVEEAFLADLQPGDAFAIGGKAVRLRSLYQDMAVVEPAKGAERIRTPRWQGNKMPLTLQLAQEELALRRGLRAEFASGGVKACTRWLMRKYKVPELVAVRASRFVARQAKAAPIPVDDPVQIERVFSKRSLMMVFHIVAGRAVNRSLAWVAARRLNPDGSVVANFDDHCFLLVVDRRMAAATEADLRRAFEPAGWAADLRAALESTDTLGRGFRTIAEIGQLLPRRTFKGQVSRKSATWNGSLLYKTFLAHEPGHPLVRECVRGVIEDECDAARAEREAARIFETAFEMRDLPRPSPFALPIFSAFNRETLLAQDPDRALEDYVFRVYEEWDRE